MYHRMQLSEKQSIIFHYFEGVDLNISFSLLMCEIVTVTVQKFNCKLDFSFSVHSRKYKSATILHSRCTSHVVCVLASSSQSTGSILGGFAFFLNWIRTASMEYYILPTFSSPDFENMLIVCLDFQLKDWKWAHKVTFNHSMGYHCNYFIKESYKAQDFYFLS